MINPVKFSLRHWSILLLAEFFALSLPIQAFGSFRIDQGQQTMHPGFMVGVANFGSWEEYKRIRQGGGVADTTSDKTGAGAEITSESAKEDATIEKQAQEIPDPLATSKEQTTLAPKATPAPAAKTTRASTNTISCITAYLFAFFHN